MLRSGDPETLTPFLSDASNLSGGHADGVVVPESEQDLVQFLREAAARRWPVTVSGRGCGLVGGRIPFGGWVISTERLHRLTIGQDKAEATFAVAGPGVSLGELQQAAAACRLMYPPDPTERTAYLGGTIATNASGARSFKYGPTRAHIRALRVVLADGRVIRLRRGRASSYKGRILLDAEDGSRVEVPMPTYGLPSTTKHVAGYWSGARLDPIDLFIGSEGTLGVVTEIEAGLRPAPPAVFGCVAWFATEEASWRFAAAVRAASRDPRDPLQARAIEYVDSRALELVRASHPAVPAQARAAITIEQECSPRDMAALREAWQRAVQQAGGLDEALWIATDADQLESIAAFRRAVPLAVNEQRRQAGQPKVGTDMAVPEEQLMPMLEAYRERLERLGVPFCVFGHIGDSHVHANLLPRTGEELAASREALTDLVKATVALGGTLSAEHGVGKLKRPWMSLQFPPEALEQMRAVKRALDPDWRLGVGNLLDP